MSGSSDSEDDDFGPVLPPPLKRERSEGTPVTVTHTASPTEVAGVPKSEAPATANPAPVAEDAEAQWHFFQYHSDLPCAALYERGFLHDRSTTPGGVRVVDAAVLEDDLGALACSVDVDGVLRVWRALPGGAVFFLGEHHHMAPQAAPPSTPEESVGRSDEGRCHARRYFVCTHAMMQWLVLARTEEYRVADDPLGSATAAGGLAKIIVELRRVNPLTLTVEAKSSFGFHVPVSPSTTVAGSTATAMYTHRPTLLQHRYEPHMAFFMTIPGQPMDAAGVVLAPCFPPQGPGSELGATWGAGDSPRRGAARVRMYAATRLSTANRIVSCVQQTSRQGCGAGADGRGGPTTGPSASTAQARTSGLATNGSALASPAVVLVDAKGILDYATIEPVSPGETAAGVEVGAREGLRGPPLLSETLSSGLTLKIIGGLAACPPTSAVRQVWQRWVRFDRRHRTGFYTIVRDARATGGAALSDGRDTAVGRSEGEAPGVCGGHVVPLGLGLSPTGRYFAVACLHIPRATRRAGESGGATGSGVYTFAVETQLCVYVMDFPTGQCIGTGRAPLSTASVSLTVGPGLSRSPTGAQDVFASYVDRLTRAAAVGVDVVESSAVRRAADGVVGQGLYILVPQVQLGVGAEGGAADSRAVGTVLGRPIHIFQVAFPRRQQPQERTGSETVCLPRCIGELEPDLGTAAATRSGDGSVHEESLCAPLSLLRRAIPPSQNLKNLVGSSPVGAALAAEELKRLVFAAARPVEAEVRVEGSTGAGAAHSTTDRLAFTTSLDGRALLVYVSPAVAARPTTAHLSATHRHAEVLRRLLSTRRQRADGGQADGGTDANGAGAAEREDALWNETCREVRAEREVSCARLLTFSARALAERYHQGSSASVGESAGASAEGGEGEERIAPGSDEGQPADVTGDPVVVAEAAPAQASTPPQAHVPRPSSIDTPEDVAVSALLSSVVLPPVAHPAPRPQRAFLSIQGYGVVELHFLPQVAPIAVRSFTALARRGYYTGLTFHRVIAGMMVQGGCPRGDGTGGESGLPGGASFPDEGLDLFPFFSHTRECLWLCMANAGKDTNGSQFFITVPDAGGAGGLPWLNGKHTVFGYVVGAAGKDVVSRLSRVPCDEQDKPLRPVTINRIDIL